MKDLTWRYLASPLIVLFAIACLFAAALHCDRLGDLFEMWALQLSDWIEGRPPMDLVEAAAEHRGERLR
jgi:hypothetical protein